jgi:pilus assembly protein Flp/PilA
MLMLDYILIRTGLNGLIARRGEEGASAVEYGLLVAGIAALVVAVVFLFGGMISDVFNDTCKAVQSKGTATSGTCAPTT